ncbi:MAG: Trp family transcriptional regulator [Patescibacteria group bacterium]
MAMGKIQYRKLSIAARKALEDELREALLGQRTKDLVELLFDLLLPSERIMLARRVQIAKRLLRGWTQHEIIRDLHVGQDTIEKVDQWLEQKFEAYHSILSPLVPKEVGKPVDPRVYSSLRRRYRWDFLLIHLLLGEP